MCDTNTTPVPRERSTPTMRSRLPAEADSSAEVGPSSTSTRGRVSSARAISTSCWLASGRSLSGRRTSTPSPSSASTGAARTVIARRSSSPWRRGSRIANRLASTLSSGNRLSSWDTTATPPRAASAVLANATGDPSISRRPESGRTDPVRIFTSVDLPAPFSPSSACTVPGRTAKSVGCSATTPP
jgi:hypothetical protein